MDSTVKHFPLVLLLLLAASTLHVQARESQFFSKAVRYEPSKEATTVHEETPAVKKEDPETLYPQSHNGYGLYGRGSEEFSSSTTTTTTYGTNGNNNNREVSTFPNTQFATESYENQNYNNRYNNKDVPYTTDNVPFKASNEVFTSGSYKKEQQGMSDTRFLENGKYFHDVSAEKYPNGYDPTSENSERYGVRRGGYGYGGYNYGGDVNRYEYNNAMEGYQNNQEKQQGPEEFIP